MRTACLQLQPRANESLDGYLNAQIEALGALGPVDMVVLPELWSVGYFEFDSYVERAETLDGPTITMLAAAARSLDAYVHVGSVLEHRGDGKVSNTSVVLDPRGEVVATYRKIHVFGYQSREPELVEPGSEVTVVDLGGLRVGLAICYDLRFPELFRQLVDADAEVFIVPATWPAARVDHWTSLLKARAIENLSYVVACNTAGQSGGVDLGGHSVVYGPFGEVLAEAGATPTVLYVDIDQDTVRQARLEFPALSDRVPDLTR